MCNYLFFSYVYFIDFLLKRNYFHIILYFAIFINFFYSFYSLDIFQDNCFQMEKYSSAIVEHISLPNLGNLIIYNRKRIAFCYIPFFS